jgi:small subunit ribosomal protein S18
MAKPKAKGRNDKSSKGRGKKEPKIRKQIKRKVCSFCTMGVKDMDYKDLTTLRKFVNEKNKIIALRTSGACAGHQRIVAIAVKRAREMALLPYCTSR